MKQEIEKRLEGLTKEEKILRIENYSFLLDMKDHWSHEDFELSKIYTEILKELKK